MAWCEHLLQHSRQHFGDRLAIVDDDHAVSYATLWQDVASLAVGLRGLGIGAGDYAAVQSRNRLEVIELYFALGVLGATTIPVHWTATPHELAGIANKYQVAAVFGEEDLLTCSDTTLDCQVVPFECETYRTLSATVVDVGDEPRHDAVADDQLLFVLHTSATTGEPKGVMIDHRSVQAATDGYLAAAKPPEGVVFLHCLPLSHGALVLPLGYLAVGATLVLTRVFTPPGCVATIRRTRATHMFLAPEMLRLITESKSLDSTDLSDLDEVIYTAAPMPRDVLRAAHGVLRCDFRQVYGLTEGGGPVAMLTPAQHSFEPGDPDGPPASVGQPILGVEVQSRTEGGEPLPVGEIGELWFRGEGVMRGYYQDTAATADAMADGWVRSGDLGRVDAKGYVYLAGRVKEVIIRGGQKIFPAEVEKCLLSHPEVSQACVVGVPDEDWSEVPYAFVVSDRPSRMHELHAIVVEQLAPYKRPVSIEVIDALPRNPAGKIQRQVLRDRANPTSKASRDVTAVMHEIVDLVESPDCRAELAADPQKPLLDHGLDSAALIALLRRIESEFHITWDPDLPATALWTVRSIAAVVTGQLADRPIP